MNKLKKPIAVFDKYRKDTVYLTGVCMCHQCCSRGEFEFSIDDVNGNYVDFAKLVTLLDEESYIIGDKTLRAIMSTIQSEAIIRMNRAYQNEDILKIAYIEYEDNPCTEKEIRDMYFEVPDEYYQRKLLGKQLILDPRYAKY